VLKYILCCTRIPVGLDCFSSTAQLVLSVLLYATDTWTLLSADVRTLDAFHQKCPRQLLGIRWYDRVRNDEVLRRTGLTSLSHLLSRRRISVFGHVARLNDVTPANVALQLLVNLSLNRPPDRTWRRPPGRPRNKWLDQLRNDSKRPIGDPWRRAVDCGHGGATTRRPLAGYATTMMMTMYSVAEHQDVRTKDVRKPRKQNSVLKPITCPVCRT